MTARWLFSQLKAGDKADQPFWLPVSAETCDVNLNDINGHHVKEEHVIAAFDEVREIPPVLSPKLRDGVDPTQKKRPAAAQQAQAPVGGRLQ